MSFKGNLQRQTLNRVLGLLNVTTNKNLIKNTREKTAQLLDRAALDESKLKPAFIDTNLIKNDNYRKFANSLPNSLNSATKKTLESALHDLPKSPNTALSSKYSVLYFKNGLSTISKNDFERLYPKENLRTYDLAALPGNKVHFQVIKARSKDTLMNKGGYYLLFDDCRQAAAYWMETLNKEINGVPVNLQFIDINQHIHMMYSPLLGETSKTFEKYNNGMPLEEIPADQKPPSGFQTISTAESPHIGDFPLPEMKRQHCVLVKNVPMHIFENDLKSELWNFDLYPNENAIQLLYKNMFTNQTVWLVRFVNETDPRRFYRKYNGSHYRNFYHSKKLIVEVLD